MPTIICDTCSKPFHIKPSRIGLRRRCSVACADTRVSMICERCGKAFLRPGWHRDAKWLRTFCSVACSRAPHTADFVGTQPRHAILWDRLDAISPDLAYWLGLMLTDGNVRETGAVSFVSLDECSTVFVRDFLSPSSSIHIEQTAHGTSAYRWHLWSKPLVERLATWNLLPRKSLTIRLPVVGEPFVWDFIRGILDGDGSVDQAGRASFSTGSRLFADDLMLFFDGQGFHATLQSKKRSFSVYLNVSSSRRLAGLIYRDGAPHLVRKRVRFH